MMQHVLNLAAPRKRANVKGSCCPGTISDMQHQVFHTIAYISMLGMLVPGVFDKIRQQILGACLQCMKTKPTQHNTYRPGHVDA